MILTDLCRAGNRLDESLIEAAEDLGVHAKGVWLVIYSVVAQRD